MDDCAWCYTRPNGDDKSCVSREQADNCAWFSKDDRKREDRLAERMADARSENERMQNFLISVLRDLMSAEAEYRSAMHIYKDHPTHPRRFRADCQWHHAKDIAKCVLGQWDDAHGQCVPSTEEGK